MGALSASSRWPQRATHPAVFSICPVPSNLQCHQRAHVSSARVNSAVAFMISIGNLTQTLCAPQPLSCHVIHVWYEEYKKARPWSRVRYGTLEMLAQEAYSLLLWALACFCISTSLMFCGSHII